MDTMLEILQGDCLSVLRTLPDRSVQCAVTSPPYFGLRNYNCEGQIGLESSVDEYVTKLVAVFREVRRVLRDDGVLWLNLGDTYAASRSYQVPDNKHGFDVHAKGAHRVPAGLKPKDLIGIPWRVAFALQADGWYLRADCIWHKPNAMPESVRDRPTKAHEYLFLLSKQERYYYDHEAIKEPVSDNRDPSRKINHYGTGQHGPKRNVGLPGTDPGIRKVSSGNKERKPRPDAPASHGGAQAGSIPWEGTMRNRRTVWSVATSPCKEAHFATYPQKLIEPCILAGTPEAGSCPQCGTPWRRIVEKTAIADQALVTEARKDLHGPTYSRHKTSTSTGQSLVGYESQTTGWHPSCACPAHEPVPAVVLDPFFGAGTTALVALEHGRKCIGIELNPDYIAIARRRLGLDRMAA